MMTQKTTTTVATEDGYSIVKDVIRGPYSSLTTFAVKHGEDTIAIRVYHPEYKPAAPRPYTGARVTRVNWPCTEPTRLARPIAEALNLAADEADALNQSYAEQWATEEIEDERDFPAHVAMILAELAP